VDTGNANRDGNRSHCRNIAAKKCFQKRVLESRKIEEIMHLFLPGSASCKTKLKE
jgi:hypothetical protein